MSVDQLNLGINDGANRLDLEQQVPANSKGFRISIIAKRARQALTVAAAACTIVATGAVLTGAAVGSALLISSVALGVLLGIEAYKRFNSKLPPKVKLVIDTVAATVTDLFAKVGLGLSFPVGLFMKEPYDHAQCGKQEPILLVHGYLSHNSHWWYIKYRLKKSGNHQVYSINLGSPFHSIEEYAQKVDAKVKEIQQRTGCKSVKIVGHSMGGVVGSYYASEVASDDSVSEVITLGSPLKGTYMAKLGLGKCSRQMEYKSDFMNRLRRSIKIAKADENCKTKFWHLGSENDLIIRPVASALASKKSDETRSTMFSGLGHVSYMFSDRVADKVISIVGQ